MSSRLGCAAIGVVVLCGCGGDARLELAASDAMSAVARQMERAVEEYHREVQAGDDARESAVVDAFIQRVRGDHADEAVINDHVAAFEAALQRIRADRQVEWQRHQAVMANVDVMREMSVGLRESAWQSMTLSDEVRRYLRRWTTLDDHAEGASGSSTAGAAVLDERIAELGGTK